MIPNSYPNSTSKDLFLQQLVYGNDDFASWFIPAAEVKEVIATGKVPQIKIANVSQQNKPKIAVILGQEQHPERKEKDYYLHPDYATAIIDAGGYPIFIAYDKIIEQLDAVKPDGIFLIGGSFNSPQQWYNKPMAEDVDKRGNAYLIMLEYAQKHHIPVFGICAGMQMLAGFFGAKLQKGINDGRIPEKSHKQNGEKIAHKVLITKDSLLYDIIQKTEILTNSSHNEAIIPNDCGNNKITAQAEDGIVEAIEPINGWNKFLLGVQWHPERLLKYSDKASAALFKAFIESCQK